MANQIIVALPRATDANGNPASGAKAYMYQTGTTTPITVYSDEALTVPHASPVVADSSGKFAQIFYGGATQPKAVVKDSADVTLYQYDPAPMVSNAASAAENVSFSPVVGNPASNVQDAIENNTTALTAKVPVTRTVSAGTGLTGGGDLSANRAFAIDEADAAAMTAGTNGKFPDAATIKDYVGWGTDGPDATTSGASHTFTGIPATATRIDVVLDGVSLSGTDQLLIQLTTGATPTTTGYVSTSAIVDGTSANNTSSTSGMVINLGGATTAASGIVTLFKVPGTNTWVESHAVRRGSTSASYGGGSITMGGAVDGVRLIGTGADTFDAGQAFMKWSNG